MCDTLSSVADYIYTSCYTPGKGSMKDQNSGNKLKLFLKMNILSENKDLAEQQKRQNLMFKVGCISSD